LKAYYGNLSNILTEIRRERTVELLAEGLRVNDLYRWKLGNLIVDRQTNNQGWLGVWVPKDQVAGMNYNGGTYTFTASVPEAGFGYNVSGSKADQNHSFSEGDHGFLTYNYKLEWNDKMYVRPIPQTVINVNKNIQQNYGW
jgi:hypothetical protein